MTALELYKRDYMCFIRQTLKELNEPINEEAILITASQQAEKVKQALDNGIDVGGIVANRVQPKTIANHRNFGWVFVLANGKEYYPISKAIA